MQVGDAAVLSRLRLVIAAVVALLILLAGWTSVTAQDAPRYRFFGFSGDVTVDGEPIATGTVIVAIINGNEVGRADVNAAGAWVLDLNSDDFDQETCNVVFEVDGLRGRHSADDCSLRVRLALSSDDPSGGAGLDGEESVDDDELTQAGPVVRPVPPSTGSGGLAENSAGSNWSRTLAITALLTLGAALAALLLSRRSDGAP